MMEELNPKEETIVSGVQMDLHETSTNLIASFGKVFEKTREIFSYKSRKIFFELFRGKSTNLDETSEKFNNSLALLSKFLLLYVPLVLFKIFSKVSNPIYTFIFILEFSDLLDAPWTPFIFVYPVCFYVAVTLTIELWLAAQVFFHYRAVDHLTVARGDRTKKDWVKVAYSSLKVGHIVCIKKGESSPADILILDSSEKIQGEVACMVSTSVISGQRQHTVKKAMNNTKVDNNEMDLKGKMAHYIRTLSGKVTAEYPTPDLKSFSGAIKLNNDPKISTASIDNIILRESVMLSDWAIVIVIYTGFYTKCLYGNSFTKLKPASFFRKHVIRLIMGSVFIFCLLVLISSASLSFMETNIKVSRTISMYLPTIPMNLWFIVELSLMINKFIIELQSRRFLQREKFCQEKVKQKKGSSLLERQKSISESQKISKGNYFELLNYESILDLGLSEYAVFDKTGTIVTNEFEIRSISTLNKRYEIQTQILESRIRDVDLVAPLLKKEARRKTVGPSDFMVVDEYQISVNENEEEENASDIDDKGNAGARVSDPFQLADLEEVPEDNENDFNLSHALQTFRVQNNDTGPHELKNPLVNAKGRGSNELGEDPNLPKVILPKEPVYADEEEEKGSEERKESSPRERSSNPKSSRKFSSRREGIYDSIIEKAVPIQFEDTVDVKNISNSFKIEPNKENNLVNSSLQNSDIIPLTPSKPFTHNPIPNFFLFAQADNQSDLFKPRSPIARDNILGDSPNSGTFGNGGVSPNSKHMDRPSSSSVTSMALNFEYQIEKDFKEDDLFNDVNKGEKAVSFLLRMFSICHDANVDSGFNRVSLTLAHKDIQVESLNGKEKALVKFANTLGYSLLFKEIYNSYDRKLGTMTVSNRNGIVSEYDILGIIHPSPLRRRFTVVMFHLGRGQSFLVSKGEPDQLMDIIFWDEDDRYIFNRLLKKNKEQGLKSTIFGYKELSHAETNLFSKKFKDAKTSLLNQEDNLEKIGLEFEKDLNYFGMVGFKDLIRPDASKCIETFKKSGLKLWLLTGDTLSNAYVAAFNSNLLPKKVPEVHFDFSREDFAISAFRKIFDKLKENKENDLFFTFIISGISVEVIKNSAFLSEHFKFLLHFCSCLIGYDLNPNHKEFLVLTLRYSRGGNEPIITAIGDGFNDYSMLKIAHFGVQVKNNHSSMINFGDGITPSLSFLSDLFQKRIKQFTYNMYIMVDYLVYNAIFQGFILFFQEFMTNYTGVPLYETVHLFLDQNVFHVLPCLVFIFVNRPHRLESLEIPQLHWENIHLRHKLNRCFLFSIGLALLQAFIFTCSLRFFIIYGVNVSGQPITLEDLFIVIKYYSIFTTNLRINVLANSHHLLFVSIMILDIGIMVACESGLGSFNNRLSLNKYSIYFNHIQTVVLMFSVAMACFMVNLILEKYIFGLARQGSFTARAFHTKAELKAAINKKMNIMETLPTITIACFRNFSKIDTTLQSLFRHKIMENSLNMSVSMFLQFRDKKIHKLFKLFFTSSKLFEIQTIGFLLLVTLAGGLLIHSVLEGQMEFIKNFGSGFLLVIWIVYMGSWAFKMNFPRDIICIMLLAVVIRIFILFNSSSIQFLTSLAFSVVLGSYFSTNFSLLWFLTGLEGVAYFVNLVVRSEKLFPSIGRNDYLCTLFSHSVLLVAFKILQSVQYMFQEKLSKMNYLAKSMFQEDVGYSKELLSLLMPKFILNRLNSYSISESLIADDAGDVTILFCDIVDFDSIVHLYNYKIVKLLDEVFRHFDILCRKHGIQKIETVGKTYMAAGGLRFVEEELGEELKVIGFTKRVLDLANDMVRHVETLTLDGGLKLKIKIGINHGSTMFGVIGYHKPQFSLIGDSVNTTSRLCTTGKEGRIMMSESAWEQLHSNKIVPEIIMTEMKGKGLVKVYHIVQRKNTMKKRIINAIANAKRLQKNDGDFQKLLKMKKTLDMNSFKYSVSAARMKQLLKNTSKFLESKTRKKAQMTLYGMSIKSFKGFGEKPFELPNSDSLINIGLHTPKPGEQIIERPNEFSQISDNDGNSRISLNKAKRKDAKTAFFETDKEMKSLKERIQMKVELSETEINFEELRKEDLVEESKNSRKDIIHPKRFWLTFRSTQKTSVKHFLKQTCTLTKKEARLILILCAFANLFVILLSILNHEHFKMFWTIFGIKIGVSFLFLLPGAIVEKMFEQKSISKLFSLLSFCYQVFLLFSVFSLKKEDQDKETQNGLLHRSATIILIQVEVTYLGFHSWTIYNFSQSLFYRFFLTISEIVFVFALDIPEKPFFISTIFILFFLMVWQKYTSSRGLIDYYNFSIYSDAKDVQIADFVDRLLPKHIHKNLGTNTSEDGDVFENVTLLFADIVGFTAYSAGRTPREVVEMLSKLFTEFDKECSRLNLYKVYTIGDCYVVMSFRDKDNRASPLDECVRVVEMGLSMISIIARVRKQLQFDGLHMRIGIHTVRLTAHPLKRDWRKRAQ